MEVEPAGEIRDDSQHADFREVRRHPGERRRDFGLGDIDGDVACRSEKGQPRQGLAAVAGT
jgi:hypothetical protein